MSLDIHHHCPVCGKKGNKRCAKLRHIIPCEKHEGRYYSRYHGCVSCSAAAAREEKALAKLVLQPAANKAVVDASSDECRGVEDDRAEKQNVKICHNDKRKGQGKKECQKRKKKKNKDEKKQVIREQRWEGRGRRRRKVRESSTACHHHHNNHEHDGLAKEKGGLVAVAVAHEKGKMPARWRA